MPVNIVEPQEHLPEERFPVLEGVERRVVGLLDDLPVEELGRGPEPRGLAPVEDEQVVGKFLREVELVQRVRQADSFFPHIVGDVAERLALLGVLEREDGLVHHEVAAAVEQAEGEDDPLELALAQARGRPFEAGRELERFDQLVDERGILFRMKAVLVDEAQQVLHRLLVFELHVLVHEGGVLRARLLGGEAPGVPAVDAHDALVRLEPSAGQEKKRALAGRVLSQAGDHPFRKHQREALEDRLLAARVGETDVVEFDHRGLMYTIRAPGERGERTSGSREGEKPGKRRGPYDPNE